MQAHIAIERRAADVQNTIETLESHEQSIASAVDALVDDLCERGFIRIHRDWSASAERKVIREAAVRAAMASVLGCDWMTELPAEARFLWSQQ